MSDQTVIIEYKGDVDDLIKSINKVSKANTEAADSAEDVGKEYEKSSKKANKSNDAIVGSLKKVGAAVAAAFTIDALIGFGKQVLAVRGEFQKFEAVLTNTLGSKSEAQKALKQIQAFAATTPFSVRELTESFVKLASQGFRPTTNELRNLGDLAASTGKSFDQLTEAIIDAQVGEFERLKEFGIRAQKEGDNVRFTFKGVQTQVKFTNQSIRDYILALGDLEGVQGATAAISETLGGKISNLGDSWDTLLNTLGGQTEGVFSTAIDLLGGLLDGITDLIGGLDRFNDKYEAQLGILSKGDKERKEFLDGFVKRAKEESDFSAVATDLIVKQRERINDAVNRNKEAFNDYYDATLDPNISKEERKRLSAIVNLTGELAEAEQSFFKSLVSATTTRENLISLLEREELIKDKNKSRDAEELTAIEKLKKEIAELNKELENQAVLNNINSDTVDTYKDKVQQLEDALKRLRDALSDPIAFDESFRADPIGVGGIGTQDIDTGVVGTDLQDRLQSQLDAEDAAAKEAERIRKDTNDRIKNESINAANDIGNALLDAQRFQLNQELFALEENERKKLDTIQERLRLGIISEQEAAKRSAIIQEEADKKRKDILTKQAKSEKALALFNATINVAEAFTEALTAGPILGPILAGIAAATGAAQIALINQQAIPQFEKGGMIGGELHKHGGTLIEAEKGEFITNRKMTSKHIEELKAINNGTFNDLLWNKHLEPMLRAINKKQREDSRPSFSDRKLLKSDKKTQEILSIIASNTKYNQRSSRFK